MEGLDGVSIPASESDAPRPDKTMDMPPRQSRRRGKRDLATGTNVQNSSVSPGTLAPAPKSPPATRRNEFGAPASTTIALHPDKTIDTSSRPFQRRSKREVVTPTIFPRNY